MPRIPRTFTNKQVWEFVEDYIKTHPDEIIKNASEEVIQAYRMGLYNGIVNGITYFSGDSVSV